jgi:hypothetical protein
MEDFDQLFMGTSVQEFSDLTFLFLNEYPVASCGVRCLTNKNQNLSIEPVFGRYFAFSV